MTANKHNIFHWGQSRLKNGTVPNQKKEENLRKKITLCIFLTIIILVIINFGNIKNYFLRKIYKIDYKEYVEKYSEEYEVDKYLVYSIIKAESNFKEDSISNKGAKGLMQLMPSTAEEIAKKIEIQVDENNILNPEININLGTKYISGLISKYENIGLALAAYNAGSGNVNSWIEQGILNSNGSNLEDIPYLETNNYVRKILRDYKIYKEIYG